MESSAEEARRQEPENEEHQKRHTQGIRTGGIPGERNPTRNQMKAPRTDANIYPVKATFARVLENEIEQLANQCLALIAEVDELKQSK